MHKSH